jgi:hypothetical protein
VPPLALASRTTDRIGEVTLAVATVLAVVLLAVTLPALLRRGPGGRRGGVTSALVIVTGGAAVTFVAWLAFAVRCTQYGCDARPGETVAGLPTWWHARHTWEWGTQLALAAVGLAVGSAALALAARERRAARRVVNLARLAYALWVIGVFAMPAVWELFLI